MARILRLALIFAILAVCTGITNAQPVALRMELAQPLATANASGKILLVDFYSNDCEWCTKMDGNLEDTDVSALIDKSFSYFKINISDPENADCAKYYMIKGTPTLIAFNGDGSVLSVCPGYMDPKPFLVFLNKAISSYIPPEKINNDLAASLKAANTSGKQLLVYFFGDWSEDCDKTDKILENPKVKAELEKHYSLCRVDVGHMDEHQSCVDQYKLNTLPTIIAFNPDGTTKAKATTVMTPAQMEAFLVSSKVFVPLANGVTAELTEAFKAARDSAKQLLVSFYDSSVDDCVKMDEAMADSQIQSEISKHYNYFKLDISDRDKFKFCLMQYRITEPPVILAFNPDGSLSGRIDGYQDVDALKNFLQMSESYVPAPEGIHPDLADALKASQEAGKTLIVDFGADWLQTSTDLDDSLSTPELKAILDAKFYLFKMDVGHFDKYKSCTGRYKVSSLPYLIAFNADGSVRTQSKGYLSPEQVKIFLDKVESGSKGFTTYNLEDVTGGGDAVKNAVKRASFEGKLLAVYFCSADVTANDPIENSIGKADAMSASASYALLQIDFSQHKALAARYGCKNSPLILLFKKDGKVGASIPGTAVPNKLAGEMERLLK